MTLTFCRDLSAAHWIENSDLPWQQLVGFGPAGFDAYGRLRILPDPARPGQSENDVEVDDWRMNQMSRLFEMLARHTTTPEDCCFCVWDGYGSVTLDDHEDAAHTEDADGVAKFARLALAPSSTRSTAAANLPQVVVPHRAYWLFRGPLAEVGAWDSALGWSEDVRLDAAEPAFVWPADRAWCVAKDVDPHWAGVGGGRGLISQLTKDRHMDVVSADPAEEQPAYL